jgi:hypothetical protein
MNILKTVPELEIASPNYSQHGTLDDNSSNNMVSISMSSKNSNYTQPEDVQSQ